MPLAASWCASWAMGRRRCNWIALHCLRAFTGCGSIPAERSAGCENWWCSG